MRRKRQHAAQEIRTRPLLLAGEIARVAHSYWEAEGRPEGLNRRFLPRADAELPAARSMPLPLMRLVAAIVAAGTCLLGAEAAPPPHLRDLSRQYQALANVWIPRSFRSSQPATRLQVKVCWSCMPGGARAQACWWIRPVSYSPKRTWWVRCGECRCCCRR